jgi:uncharacterized protein GlcG (DUF336 family)
MGFGGRELARRVQNNAAFMTSLMVASGGKVVPNAGGVLVKDAGGTIIGAVGISGDTSENDEACAVAGIKAASLTADTGDAA